MTTKVQLIEEVLAERAASINEPETFLELRNESTPPFSRMLPTGDGGHLILTPNAERKIAQYADIVRQNTPNLNQRFTRKSITALTKQAFGTVLARLENGTLEADEGNHSKILQNEVDNYIEHELSGHDQQITFVSGCQLFQTPQPLRIEIGPVVFSNRSEWLVNARERNWISAVTARRAERAWLGHAIRKRKFSQDSMLESDLLKAVGDCPFVCEVQSRGLSADNISTKSMLSARLAMASLALLWRSPSRILFHMKLEPDGNPRRRHHITFREDLSAASSSEISEAPVGQWLPEDFSSTLNKHGWLWNMVGSALSAFLEPSGRHHRPQILNALLMSLYWYHEACREALDATAVVKFAASMDALTGGRRENGIVNLLAARAFGSVDQGITDDGRSLRAVVREIYSSGRSRLVHGTSNAFGHDWGQDRAYAETLGSYCLLACCRWLHDNPQERDLQALSQ